MKSIVATHKISNPSEVSKLAFTAFAELHNRRAANQFMLTLHRREVPSVHEAVPAREDGGAEVQGESRCGSLEDA